jgi:hypothetical protein
MEVKDLNSDIEKYIKTNYPDYKTTEVFKYVMYEMVMHKADTSKYLVFDANGKFVRKKKRSS